MLRHLPWYALLRPARLGDWPLAALHAALLAFSATMLVLTFSPRGDRLWAAWGRCVRAARGARQDWGKQLGHTTGL